jgi:hypothetical protein
MDEAELAEQVAGYSTLSIGKSYRKVSAMLWLLSVVATFLLGRWLMKMDWTDIAASAVIYSTLAIFCYRGHRWAFLLSMIMWTFEKGYSLVQAASGTPSAAIVVPSILWWAWYVGTFWKAFTVERVRRRVVPPTAAIG